MGPSRTRAILHAGFLCLLCLAMGCRESIALGSECPSLGARCSDDERAPLPATAGDAATAFPDGSPSRPNPDRGEGGPPNDAEAGTPPGRFPDFHNPSFEITSGATSGGLISSFVVQVSPWLGCSPPGFGPGAYPRADLRADTSSGTPAATELLSPSEGMSLLITSADGTSAAQTLAKPLVAGTRYAFMVDIAGSEGASALLLEVQGSNGCLSPAALTTSTPARTGVWTAVCVTFTPDRAHSSLMLAAVATPPDKAARLFIDNIRKDPACE